MKTVVVGAGLGGLSAACHLAGAGHDVTVVERASVPGGRAGLLNRDGYQFDTGPTVLTMTGILGETFRAAGCEMSDHLQLNALDPAYRACFPDGSEIRCRHGVEAMRAEIATKCSEREAIAFERFCQWLGELYRVERENFIDRNFDSPLDMLSPVKPIVELVKLGGLRKLASTVDGYFKDERLRRIFSFQAMYAGLSPFDALAIYAVITYMDSVEGVYFPTGGMHSVSKGLATAAEKAGAQFIYNAPVVNIERDANGVKAIQLDTGERITADAVVLNGDLPVMYRDLLPELSPPRATVNGKYSPSCLVWLAGVKGQVPDDVAHHNIHFGGEWREAFDALLRDGRPMPDPSILVTVPTQTDASLAPHERSTLYVLEPMPNLDGNIDWNIEFPARKQRLIEQVASNGYPVDIEVEDIISPLTWQQRGMERGTPFALSHHFFQTGPFRPKNFEKRAPGVFFTGSGTTPGVGIPMVLLSGKHVAQRIERFAS